MMKTNGVPACERRRQVTITIPGKAEFIEHFLRDEKKRRAAMRRQRKAAKGRFAKILLSHLAGPIDVAATTRLAKTVYDFWFTGKYRRKQRRKP